MAKKLKEYTKLPGSKKGFLLGRYTLWQGADHLLYIFARFGVEDYKRFYFGDIQAIIIRKTVTGKVRNGILGGLAFLFLLFVFSVTDSRSLLLNGWAIFWIVMSAIMALSLLINFFMGPTCETRLLTAVQTEKLQSLNRLKRAFKIADQLRPLILQAQRSVLGEKTIQQQPGPDGPNRPRRTTAAGTGLRKDTRNENGRVHMMLFALLLFDGLLATSEFFVSHVATTILSSVASLGGGILVIMALVRQHKSDLPSSLCTITWTCLGFVGLTFVMGYAVAMVMAFNNPRVIYNQWEIVNAVSVLSPWDSPLKLSCNLLVLSGAVFLAIPGLMVLQRFRRRAKHPMTVPPASTRQRAISMTPEAG